MFGRFKYLLILIIILLIIPISSAVSEQDIDGDGISNTLEIERGTDPYSKESEFSNKITGALNVDVTSVNKDAIVLFILTATVIIEMSIFYFIRRNK